MKTSSLHYNTDLFKTLLHDKQPQVATLQTNTVPINLKEYISVVLKYILQEKN